MPAVMFAVMFPVAWQSRTSQVRGPVKGYLYPFREREQVARSFLKEAFKNLECFSHASREPVRIATVTWQRRVINNGKATDMQQSTDRILTTHVGSLARPDHVLEALFAKERGEGLNLADFGAAKYGPAFTIETTTKRPYDDRVKTSMLAVQTAVRVFEEQHR